MELKVNLTLDDIDIISAALHNDASVYMNCAIDEIDDEECFNDNMESYRQRMLLMKMFDKLATDNLAFLVGDKA